MTLKARTNNAEISKTLSVFVVTLAAFGIYITSGGEAFAGLSSAIEKVHTEANSVAPLLAKLAVFALGVGAVFGRISVPQALVVATGIAIAASASSLAGMVSGSISSSVQEVNSVAGSVAGPLCIISLIVLGIATMFGKMSWTQALAVAIGIGLLGGYDQLASELYR